MLALQTAGRCWAIRPETLATLTELHGRFVDVRLARTVALRNDRRPVRVAGSQQNVAIVPLKGMITPQGSMLAAMFGCDEGGLQAFRADLAQAAADPAIKAIVMDIDSPGGLTDQVPETGAAILAAREEKPIVAVANTTAASAAYWLATQAHELVVTPSGEVGSVGVYQIHKDVSAALEKEGVKPTIISAGEFKTEGSPFQPLDPEALQSIQGFVNDYYAMFVKAVADGRGEPVPELNGHAYGGGRVMMAKRAVASGLADRVATIDQTVNRLTSGRAAVRQVATVNGYRAMVDYDDGVEDPEIVAAPPSAPTYSREETDRLLDTLAGLR